LIGWPRGGFHANPGPLRPAVDRIQGVIRANRPKRLPVVLTKPEVRLVFLELEGTPRLVCHLLYGAGLRLLEGLRLRVKDLDFQRNEITVREGKGNKDRITMLPELVKPEVILHLEKVRRLHEKMTLPTATGRFTFQMPWSASCQERPRSGNGNTSSPRPRCRSIRGPG
jgi:integrase